MKSDIKLFKISIIYFERDKIEKDINLLDGCDGYLIDTSETGG